MKRFYRPWLHIVLIITLLASLLPMSTASAASRISIVSLYVTASPSDIVNGRPKDDNKVPRVTTSTINLTATVEGISDAQISSLYLDITNVTSNRSVKEDGIKAQKIPNSFDVVFNGVPLTEGLNKVVVKLGETSIVESAPGWVYYTATTNISDLTINGEPFLDNTIYPLNPEQSTAVSIRGVAPNATGVEASINNGSPVSGFFSPGDGIFSFIGDDINKATSIANLKLTPGDNPITFLAKNSSKAFQLERNLIYDNGKPFVFGANIQYDADNNPNTVDWSTAQKLITNPTVKQPRVKVDAKLKVDLDTNGLPQYRYVEVTSGGEKYGPFDLGKSGAAQRVTDLFPKSIIAGHSQFDFTVVGTAVDDVKLYWNTNSGNGLGTALTAGTVSEDKTLKIFTLPASMFITTDSPYKLTATKADGATVLGEFQVNVSTPVGTTVPTVSNIDVINPGPPQTLVGLNAYNLKQGYGTTNLRVTFTGAVPDASKSSKIEIVNMAGTTVMGTRTVSTYNGGTSFDFVMPPNLVQGEYKMRVLYNNNILHERYFKIGYPDPANPVITSVVTNKILPGNAANPTGKTYLYVQGNGFGMNPNTQIVPKAFGDRTLTYVDHKDNLVIFELDREYLPNNTQDSLDSGTYNVDFDVKYDVDGNGSFDITKSAGPAVAGANQVQAVTPPAADYKDMTVTSINQSQVLVGSASNIISVNGKNLSDAPSNLLLARISLENGTFTGQQTAVTVTSATYDKGEFTLPALTADNYILQFVSKTPTAETIVAQYPFSVANPSPAALNPSVVDRDLPDADRDGYLTLTGAGFGRDTDLLQLKFTSDANSSLMYTETAKNIINGSIAKFDAPSGMGQGSYTVRLLYDGNEVGAPMKYTVSLAAQLQENAQWSKKNEYVVYDFSSVFDLPPDRRQDMSFRFFNIPTDNVPPTTFVFYYENDTLPYISHAAIDNSGAALRLSEGATNAITEMPATLYIYANAKTNSINYYVGEYKPSSTPKRASRNFTIDPVTGLRKFTVTLNTLPSGLNDITFVPSITTYTTDNDSSTAPGVPTSKSGENLAARKPYRFNVSSTPYVIVNNLFNGMVIKSSVEISCGTTSSTLTQCIQGRLVNIPDFTKYRIVVQINDDSFTLTKPTDFKDSLNPDKFTFWFGPGSDHPLPGGTAGDLKEGKNVIKFLIYDVGGTRPITEASYEVFKFSKNAPEFINIKPIESGDISKYIQSENQQNRDAYATNETTVAFSGQFANAEEIKLTVRTIDPVTNQTITLYDRRHGSNFSQFEPTSSNPNYFAGINTPQAGQFTTRQITLSPKGDTVFEFSITNSTNIVVTRTLTITREPLPYVIVSPKLIKNNKGQDQANINSNYYEIELEAENADDVLFGKDKAVPRQVIDPATGLPKTHFFYEARDLKNGANTISFTVTRGTEKVKGNFILNNVNTPIEGAQFKSPIKTKLSVFNKQLELSFPRGTVLRRNDPSAVNQFITTDRQILFGIANSIDGRVNKYKHPAPYDGQIGNPNPPISSDARLLLTEPTGRFRPVSPLFWIDAGTILSNETDLRKALNGSGELPYDGAGFYNRSLKDLVVPSQVGTLTLQYDPTIRQDAWKYVSVYHYDIYEDYRGVTGPRWRNIGGVVDPKKNTITVPFERFGYYQVVYMDQSFDDVIAHAWARDDLDILYSKGIMLNKTSTNFVPNDPITRGEFATLLVKIFDIPLNYSEDPTFSDVLRVNPLANGLYDYKYIETAAKAGIVRGAGGGRFQPDNAITRQDAAVMIARAANLKLGTDPDKVLKSLQKQFTDANGIDMYARSAIDAVVGKGLILGKENVLLEGQKKATYRFDPTATFTRAEAAAVALRVMKDQKKVPK
ncbi:S-layer homology domain-containing protein [Paenibacillus thermotolerans]|uniref:S-layer homology domain-containing protein n=1 Tax=Paenibacillus thermotolerans TaxID=3027807 RepID=UPI0023688CC8|nr:MULTISPECIES: S-layer homology domain-containing protein [unclassified Paenibacillus]